MFLSDYAVAPHEYIEEWLEDEDVSQAELARRMGVSPKHVSKIMDGATLTVDVALKLEKVTGISSEFWIKVEGRYRSELKRLEEAKELETKDVPVRKEALKALRDRGIINFTQRPGEKGLLLQELMKLMRVGNYKALLEKFHPRPGSTTAYRQTSKNDPASAALWLQLGERELERSKSIPEYDREALERLVPDLRSLTAKPPEFFGQRLVELLNEVGVYLLYVRDLPGSATSGATWWSQGNPVIQLSLRHKRDDTFWFTLFHEIGHVLRHSHEGVFVRFDKNGDSEIERDADKYAADTLIPSEYAQKLYPRISLEEIESLAQELEIAPGIIVGRCHHDGYLDYSVGRGFIENLVISAEDDGVA